MTAITFPLSESSTTSIWGSRPALKRRWCRNVHGEGRGPSGGSDRPARFDFQGTGINGNDFVLVF